MTIGSELKEARQSRKITLEMVSKKTKIPVKYLEALEENRFDIFPSHTYVKGFIRAYAKVVGVDPQVLTRQFNAEAQPENVRLETKNAEAELEKTLGWRPTLNRPPVFRRLDTPNDMNLEMADEEFADPARREPAAIRRQPFAFRKGFWIKWAGLGATLLAVVVLVGGVYYLGHKVISKIHWSSAKTASSASGANGYEPVKIVDK